MRDKVTFGLGGSNDDFKEKGHLTDGMYNVQQAVVERMPPLER